MNFPTERKCNSCKKVKPAAAFNAYLDKRRGAVRPKLHSHCRQCRQDRAKCITPPDPMDAYLRDWARNVEPGQPAWRVA